MNHKNFTVLIATLFFVEILQSQRCAALGNSDIDLGEQFVRNPALALENWNLKGSETSFEHIALEKLIILVGQAASITQSLKAMGEDVKTQIAKDSDFIQLIVKRFPQIEAEPFWGKENSVSLDSLDDFLSGCLGNGKEQMESGLEPDSTHKGVVSFHAIVREATDFTIAIPIGTRTIHVLKAPLIIASDVKSVERTYGPHGWAVIFRFHENPAYKRLQELRGGPGVAILIDGGAVAEFKAGDVPLTGGVMFGPLERSVADRIVAAFK